MVDKDTIGQTPGHCNYHNELTERANSVKIIRMPNNFKIVYPDFCFLYEFQECMQWQKTCFLEENTLIIKVLNIVSMPEALL